MRAVIVSHGQPGDPGPQQDAIEALAAEVAPHAGFEVVGATLAQPGALAAALQPGCLVYPMFMAEGWFTGRELPRRLAETGVEARVLRPFGVEPALAGLCRAAVARAINGAGWDAREVTLLLVAHGSQRSQSSAEGARAMAARLALEVGRVVTGFVEQEPYLAEAARYLDERAICLPFFALRAEHVTDDIPQALDAAGFAGLRLDPIGLDPGVPALIGASLRAQAS